MRKKILLVLGIVFTVLFAAACVLSVVIATTANIVNDTGIRTGQQNNTIEYDAENDIFFLTTRTGSLLAFNNATQELIWEFKNESGQPMTCTSVHTASGTVYAGSDDRNVYILDLNTGALKETYSIERTVKKVAINSDATKLAVVTQTNSNFNAMLLDVTNGGEKLFNEKYSYGVKEVRWAPDQQSLVYADARGRMFSLNLDGSTAMSPVSILDRDIVDFKPDGNGNYMAMDNLGRYVVVDATGNILRQGAANMVEGCNVYCGGIDSDGNIIVGTKQGYVYVMNANDQQIYSYRQAGQYTVNSFTTDGVTIYSTGYGDFVESIECAKLQLSKTLGSLAGLTTGCIIGFAFLAIAFLMLYFKASYILLCKIGKAIWKHKIAYILLIPTFVLLIMFNYIPMFVALARAFTNWSAKRYTAADMEFVGFYNFKRMITEGYFLIGIKNMLILMISGMIKTLTMPIIAAWLVYSFNSDKRKFAYRFLFVLPMVVPGLVGSLMWEQIYNPGGGLDQILTALGLESWIHVWLGEAKTAIWSIVFMGPPYIGTMPFLLYYGGLTSIDANLYEAARIDGANRWHIFWQIQIPMIAPQMKLLIMLQFIGSVQDYGGIYLLTGGGPGVATYVPGLELFYNATQFGNYGYACAMGLVMFIIIMIGTFFNNKIKATNYNA